MNHKNTCASLLVKSSNPEQYGICDCKDSHQKLLAKIDEELSTNYADECGNFPIGLKALRAVVELHKPIQMRMPHGAIYCMGCGRDHEFNDYWIEYPCETIKTIEKALA